MAGLLEAVLLVLVVKVATQVVAVEQNGSGIDLAGQANFGIGWALIIAALAGFATIALHIRIASLISRISSDVLRGSRDQAIDAFCSAEWETQAEVREGSLQETMSSLAVQTATLVTCQANFLSSLLGLIALISVAFVVDVRVTVMIVLVGAVLFMVLRPVGRLTRTRAMRFVEKNSEFSEEVSRWGSLAMDLRVFGVESVEAERLHDLNQTTADEFMRSRFVSRVGSYLYKDMAMLVLVGAVAVLFLSKGVQIGTVGAVIMLVVRSLSYAQQTQGSLQLAREQFPGFVSLRDRVDALALRKASFGDAPIQGNSSLELVNVSYRYPDGRIGLDGVSLHVHPGFALGVIGQSGSGKSTLVQVLLRLRLPTTGSVTIGGTSTCLINTRDWSRYVCLVPQEPRLIEGTIADNIVFMRSGIDRSDVERVARAAHILDEINELPEGFDTLLGPRGSGLSGGQKQRVAIARALVGNPHVLVLDEPTSALDVRSEALLQRTIVELRKSMSLIIIAHRTSTLSACDAVAVMSNGQIVEIGSLEEALRHVSIALQ